MWDFKLGVSPCLPQSFGPLTTSGPWDCGPLPLYGILTSKVWETSHAMKGVSAFCHVKMWRKEIVYKRTYSTRGVMLDVLTPRRHATAPAYFRKLAAQVFPPGNGASSLKYLEHRPWALMGPSASNVAIMSLRRVPSRPHFQRHECNPSHAWLSGLGLVFF